MNIVVKTLHHGDLVVRYDAIDRIWVDLDGQLKMTATIQYAIRSKRRTVALAMTYEEIGQAITAAYQRLGDQVAKDIQHLAQTGNYTKGQH